MAQRMIIFDPQTVLRLLTHYTEGRGVPLTSECVGVAAHKDMQRLVQFLVDSPEWREEDLAFPVWLGYEGRKISSWSEKGTPVEWKDANETPRRIK